MAQIAPIIPDRFTSAIPHYVSGRPRYSDRLIAKLADETKLTPSSRVLDLGCGPGSLTIPLSRYAGTTIGIDIDPEMIATAEAAAKDAGAVIDWRVGTSFDLDSALAPLDLVTIARALPLDGSRGDVAASRYAHCPPPAALRSSTPSCIPLPS